MGEVSVDEPKPIRTVKAGHVLGVIEPWHGSSETRRLPVNADWVGSLFSDGRALLHCPNNKHVMHISELSPGIVAPL